MKMKPVGLDKIVQHMGTVGDTNTSPKDVLIYIRFLV